MNILKVGDREKAACNKCKAFVTVSYDLRNVPFSDGSGIVKDVLVGVCEKCDSVCVLPHQSTPAVENELEKQRKPVEARVPAHMIDILNLASVELGCKTSFSQVMIKYYIHCLANKKISSTDLGKYLKSDLAQGKAEKRISLKGCAVREDLLELQSITHLKSNTKLIKSVILKIKDDILEHNKPRFLKSLKEIAVSHDECRL